MFSLYGFVFCAYLKLELHKNTLIAEHTIMKYLMFIRHGNYVRNPNYYYDDRQVCLSDLGKIQAENLRQCLQSFEPDYIVTSPILRCVETTNIITSRYESVLPIFDERLKERTFPSLFNKSFVDLEKILGVQSLLNLRQFSENFEIGNEETILESENRVLSSVNEHVRKCTKKIAIISHGGPHRWLVCNLLGLQFDSIRFFYINEAHFSLFECEDNGQLKKIISLNSTENPNRLYKKLHFSA